nr:hypothetical protein Iba_chr10bCG12330 [Ipomoea batatas]
MGTIGCVSVESSVLNQVILLLQTFSPQIVYVTVFHPGNTIQITQAGLIFRRRTRILSWTVCSPATLYSI